MPSTIRQRLASLFGTFLLLATTAVAWGNTPAFPWEGEVSGSGVYVRSGAGANWYPTTKLNTGDHVLVLGEKFGWYQITPPPASFSYIDMAMVDRKAGARTGTVKQDKVYVRAGSTLEQRKNATQLVLNKGASVEILGEAEGFFKIAPPPGATLYISKQYVKPVEAKQTTGLVERYVSTNPKPPVSQVEPDATESMMQLPPLPVAKPEEKAAALDPVPVDTSISSSGLAPDSVKLPVPLPEATNDASPEAEGTEPAEPRVNSASTLGAVEESNPATVSKPQPTKPAAPGLGKDPRSAAPAEKVEPGHSRFQAMLAMCESELVSMLEKPLEQQDPGPLLKKYEEIASQSDEYVPSEVAKIRVRQLRERTKLRETHVALHADEKELSEYRANMDAERMKIMRRRVEEALDTFDLEGELRRSLAFAPENRRFRLVDPATNSTIAYVDIPRSVEENPEFLVGRKVGIKVAGRTFSPSARVPIAVAHRVVDLSPRQSNPDVQPISRDRSRGSADQDRAEGASDGTTIRIPRKTTAATDGELEPE